MPQWDIFRASDLSQVNAVEESDLIEMIRRGELSSEDCIRPTGDALFRRLSEVDARLFKGKRPERGADRGRSKEAVKKASRPETQPPAGDAKGTAKPKERATSALSTELIPTRDVKAASRPPRPAAPPVPSDDFQLADLSISDEEYRARSNSGYILADDTNLADESIAFVGGRPLARAEPSPVAEPPEESIEELPPEQRVDSPEVAPAPAQSAEPETTAPESLEDPATGPLRKRKPLVIEEFDLTPMVDMVFLLLLFFMLTASYSKQKTIEIPAPNPEQKGTQQLLQTLEELRENSIIINVEADNSILVDDELVPVEQLAIVLRESVRSTGRAEVIILANESAFHETVVAVIDAANDVGIQRIRMASAKPASGSDQ